VLDPKPRPDSLGPPRDLRHFDARMAKRFGRDTSSTARNVAKLEERMATARELRSLCANLAPSFSHRQNATIHG
jgi:hypothetical protein